MYQLLDSQFSYQFLTLYVIAYLKNLSFLTFYTFSKMEKYFF